MQKCAAINYPIKYSNARGGKGGYQSDASQRLHYVERFVANAFLGTGVVLRIREGPLGQE